MTDNIRNYIDIPKSNEHHVNWIPTEHELEIAEYSDYSKIQLHRETCSICYIQQCWVHEHYPIPPEGSNFR